MSDSIVLLLIILRVFTQDTFIIIKIHALKPDFERESSILHRLNKEVNEVSIHVPDLLGCQSQTDRPYLVMKSCGLPLTHFLSIRSKNEYRLEIARQLLMAVIWLHGRDVIHCDVKPENLLVEDVGGGYLEAKICDFDSAVDVGGDFPSGLLSDGRRALKFTKQWASPEVYLHNRTLQGTNAISPPPSTLLAAKSMDVFALGLVLSCLFRRERSALMTVLPFDDDDLYIWLTQRGILSDHITCDSILSADALRGSIRSLCELSVSTRGELSSALDWVEKLQRTELQESNSLMSQQLVER